MSLERLLATADAHRRLRAADLLVLVQAAKCDGETWQKLQQRLIEEMDQ